MCAVMESSAPQYRSYLLRLWRTGEEKAWRAMVECVDSHERRCFADLESLCAFLRAQTGHTAKPPMGSGMEDVIPIAH